MFDYFDYETDTDYRYKFVKDGTVIGEFTAEARKPYRQAMAERDEKYPGAEIFVNMLEPKGREQKEEVSEDVAA